MNDESPGSDAAATPDGPHAPSLQERLTGAPPWAIPLATVVIRRVAITAVVTLAAVWVFLQTSSLVALILLAFFFSLALEPGVSWLHEHRGMRRGTATGVMYVGIVVFLVLLVLLIIPLTAELAGKLGQAVPELADRLNELTAGLSHNEIISSEQAQAASDQINTSIREWFRNFGGTVLGIATTGLSLVFNLLTLGLFTFYMTANAPNIRRVLSSRLPGPAQQRFNWAWETATRQTGGYFYSRLLLMFVNGGLFFFVMVAIGIPVKYSLPLSIFEGFVAEFIPAVGTYIGAAVPILFVLVELGMPQAVILLIWTIIYQQVENAWLSPKLSSKTMSLNAGVAFGSALAGGTLFGPMGAFVALPVAGMVTAFLTSYTRSYELVDQFDDAPGGDGDDSATVRRWWSRLQRPESG